MSDFNVNSIVKIKKHKNERKKEIIKQIMKKIKKKIEFYAVQDKEYCTFEIPNIMFGYPLYDANKLGMKICRILIKKGFKANLISHGVIFIDWRQENNEKSSSSESEEIEDDDELDEQYKNLAKTQVDKQTLVFEDLKKTADKYKRS